MKLEGDLDRLSDLFNGLDSLLGGVGGNSSSSSSNSSGTTPESGDSGWSQIGSWINRNILVAPGWLARAVHDVSEYLCDGDRGVIPALRACVGKNFGEPLVKGVQKRKG